VTPSAHGFRSPFLPEPAVPSALIFGSAKKRPFLRPFWRDFRFCDGFRRFAGTPFEAAVL